MNPQIKQLQHLFGLLFGGIGQGVHNIQQNLEEGVNNVSRAATGHAVINRGAPVVASPPRPVNTPLKDPRAAFIGSQSNNPYNAAIQNYNQMMLLHSIPLNFSHPDQNGFGSNLQVRPAAPQSLGYATNPFDVDTQALDPMHFGTSRNYYGQQPYNPQVRNIRGY